MIHPASHCAVHSWLSRSKGFSNSANFDLHGALFQSNPVAIIPSLSPPPRQRLLNHLSSSAPFCSTDECAATLPSEQHTRASDINLWPCPGIIYQLSVPPSCGSCLCQGHALPHHQAWRISYPLAFAGASPSSGTVSVTMLGLRLWLALINLHKNVKGWCAPRSAIEALKLAQTHCTVLLIREQSHSSLVKGTMIKRVHIIYAVVYDCLKNVPADLTNAHKHKMFYHGRINSYGQQDFVCCTCG